MDPSVYLLLSVVARTMDDIFQLGRHSGLIRIVSDCVNVCLEAGRWSARIKAVGRGNNAKWLTA